MMPRCLTAFAGARMGKRAKNMGPRHPCSIDPNPSKASSIEDGELQGFHVWKVNINNEF